jgi:DNA-binding NarL/FixJ family response regulator
MAASGVFKDESWAGLAARLLKIVDEPARATALVVDDDAAYAELLTLALELSDRFTVVGHAVDGHDAIEQAAWLRPEVVLMDVQMPVLDGIEATPRVLAAAPRTKVVAVSSSRLLDHRLRAREAGAIGFLDKYAPPDELVRELERLVFPVVPLTRRRLKAVSADRPSMS